VSVPTRAIHHDKRYFSNSGKFIPTRWIDEEKKEETCVKEAWIPFGFGLRNCVAKAYDPTFVSETLTVQNSLALMEIRLTLAMFAFTFDAELVEQAEPSYMERLVAIRGPLFVRVKRV
jgi:cytochrome P450